MHIPKKYGQGRIDLCPFCKKNATTKNNQQIPVCHVHKASIIQDLTCFCGGHLELKNGKFGVYYHCINCGNMNLNKALEMNLGNEPKTEKKQKTEITITSDEVDLYYS